MSEYFARVRQRERKRALSRAFTAGLKPCPSTGHGSPSAEEVANVEGEVIRCPQGLPGKRHRDAKSAKAPSMMRRLMSELKLRPPKRRGRNAEGGPGGR